MTEALCPFCGDPEVREVLEAWLGERAFLVDACCEDAQEETLALLRDPARRREHAALFADVGLDVRRVYDDDVGSLLLDFGLELAEVDLATAKAFTAEHHAHRGEDGKHHPTCGWRWGHAVYNGSDLVGVAMVGRPVARLLDKATIVEVNRVAVRRDVHAALRWNACSMLYGAACREAKRRGFPKVVTYTLDTEAAATVKAAGFVAEATTRGGSWDRPSRRRGVRGPTGRKVRWARMTGA